MDPPVSMIMTGARDIGALRTFYEDGLGWRIWGPASAMSVMHRVGHSVLVFLNSDYLAKDRGEPVGAKSQTSLAVSVASKAEVDATWVRARKAGASETSGVRDRDGELYSGYFADPEGNSWEIDWSPHMPLAADGALTLPGVPG